jgi:hypothetical protein
MAKYKRILLKLSGESLMGAQGYGIDPQRLGEYAKQIKEIADLGVQIGIVIGGGNIFRGLSGASKGFDRYKGDQMGMLATVINAMALCSALESIGQKARVLTAIRMEPIGELYSKPKAIEALEEMISNSRIQAMARVKAIELALSYALGKPETPFRLEAAGGERVIEASERIERIVRNIRITRPDSPPANPPSSPSAIPQEGSADHAG